MCIRDRSRIKENEADAFAGFVVDTKPDLEISEILDSQIWMGSQDVAADKDSLDAVKITHILNVGTG